MKFIEQFNEYMFSDRLSMFDMMVCGFLLMVAIDLKEPLLMLIMFPLAFFSAWMNNHVVFKYYDKG